MRGLITGRDVFLQAFTIVRLWGVRAWLRCLRAALSKTPSTFLAVVQEPPARACRIRRLCAIAATRVVAATGRADVKIAEDAQNGGRRISGRTTESVDATDRCRARVVRAGGFVDDGFEGREERRDEIRFGAAR